MKNVIKNWWSDFKKFDWKMYLALCLLALVITVLPAYIHAYSGNFLNEMVDAVFLSNFRYLGSASDKNVLLVWICRLMVTAIFGGFIVLWFL